MNRFPYATAIISVVVAVTLWLIATWLESDSPWLVPGTEPAVAIKEVQVRPDTPVRRRIRQDGDPDFH